MLLQACELHILGTKGIRGFFEQRLSAIGERPEPKAVD